MLLMMTSFVHMRNIGLIFILITILSGEAYSQNSTWIFGWGASVNFENGEPNTGPEGPIFTAEGCATMSDSNGQLLFSTDGIRIYDRNGDVMEGGTGLQGDESSTQNALIAPRPLDSESRYYHVFTVSAQDNLNGTGGLYHSIVDMEANGGLGEMITTPELLVGNVGEKLHATMHADGNQMWIVTHRGNTNDFYAFLLGCEGVDSENPVISSTGDMVEFYNDYLGAIGSLKLSHSGERIAMTNLIEIEPGIPGSTKLQTGRFNNETGEVEIQEILEEEGELIQGYGVEFSPNSQYVYWSTFGMSIRRIVRFDLTSADIPSSRHEVVNAANGQSYAQLQLGPDNKIYVARSNGAAFLSRIENPDEPNTGDLVFTDNAVVLNGISTLGLPNDWNYQLNEISSHEEFEIFLCEGSSKTLSASDFLNATYAWDTGQNSREITVQDESLYTVMISHPCFTRTENYTVSKIDAPDYQIFGDLEFCEGSDTEIEIISEAEILWWDGNPNSGRNFSTGGSYNFVHEYEGCTFANHVELTEKPLPKILFDSEVYSKCSDQRIVLRPDIKNADSRIWSTGQTNESTTVSAPGKYSITVENLCGEISKIVEVENEDCECDLYVPNAFSPNGDGTNDIFKPVCECQILDYELSIYNRWGELVFHSTDASEGWIGNGSTALYFIPSELYTYKLKGTPVKNGKRRTIEKTGFIQVAR